MVVPFSCRDVSMLMEVSLNLVEGSLKIGVPFIGVEVKTLELMDGVVDGAEDREADDPGADDPEAEDTPGAEDREADDPEAEEDPEAELFIEAGIETGTTDEFSVGQENSIVNK